MMKIKPKVRGSGVITHRCVHCGKPINGDPLYLVQNGRLVAVHADCHQKET